MFKFGIISEAKVSLHGHLVSDSAVILDDARVVLDTEGVEESVKIGVIMGEFSRSLREDETNGFDIHSEGCIMV